MRNATETYGERVADLQKGLREQIKTLGLEVDTYGQATAAKLRAALQSKAMQVAGVAEYQAVDATTRALIEQAVARQEHIDRLAGSEKSTRAVTAATQEHRDEVADYIRSLEDQNRLLGMDARERAITEAVTRAQNIALKDNNTLTAEQVARIRELVGVRYDQAAADRAAEQAREDQKRELEKFGQDVTRVAENIGSDISENLWDQITGEAKAEDAIQFFKNWAKRLGVELLNQRIVLPITQQIVGSAPGLFGISSPAGGVAGQGGYLLSNIASLGGMANQAGLFGDTFTGWGSSVGSAIDSFGASTGLFGAGSAWAAEAAAIPGVTMYGSPIRPSARRSLPCAPGSRS
ncbi:MAG TPA: hypothetical protein VEB64_02755 [Azospirillaceae bacterium]|nr:hypothetical protein [Azospirillaceae bacterium]